MNDSLLTSLGLSSQEVKVFQAVSVSGQATPTVLGKTTGIKRTTAYHIARVLAEKGLLVEDASKRPRVFSTVTPQEIQSLIEGDRLRYNARTKKLQQLAAELSRTQSEKTYPVPHTRFVESEKLESFLRSETPKWHKSIVASDATWWGFQDHTFIDVFGKLTEKYWRSVREPVSAKLLSNQSDTEGKIFGKYPRRSIKFWPKSSDFISTTWVIGDYVVMVNTRQKPFYLVEILDATLAHDLREVFKNLWGLL